MISYPPSGYGYKKNLKKDLDPFSAEVAYGPILRLPGKTFVDGNLDECDIHLFLEKSRLHIIKFQSRPMSHRSSRTNFVRLYTSSSE